MNGELTIGAFGASVILSIVLRMIYNTYEISNRLKPWLAVLIGVALGMVAMRYNLSPGTAIGFRLVCDHVFAGIMMGATAVGLYEMTKKPSL